MHSLFASTKRGTELVVVISKMRLKRCDVEKVKIIQAPEIVETKNKNCHKHCEKASHFIGVGACHVFQYRLRWVSNTQSSIVYIESIARSQRRLQELRTQKR